MRSGQNYLYQIEGLPEPDDFLFRFYFTGFYHLFVYLSLYLCISIRIGVRSAQSYFYQLEGLPLPDHFYRTQVSLGSDLWVLMSLHPTPFADLTDVTLADEDSNSIPTDDVNRAIQQCKWHHLVAKIETNASGTIWWPNL